jgi:hypothetical protein
MSTPESRLLEMLNPMEGDEARIDEPIMMAQAAPGQLLGETPPINEGFQGGLSDEEALGLRADIWVEEGPANRRILEEHLGEQDFTPERRVNPYAPQEGEGRQRKNPYAPRQPKQTESDFPSDFPMERGTSRASLQLPELGSQVGMGHFFNVPGEEELPKWAQYGLVGAVMTTTDPNEIAQIFTQEVEVPNPETGEVDMVRMFPHIGLQTAPDGTLVLTNNKTGARAIINRPGMSSFDAMQLAVLGATFTPAGRGAAVAGGSARILAQKAATETAKRLALRQARRKSAMALMAGSGVTETGMQLGQEAAGGEFNKADIAMSTAFGAVPDYVFDPLARFATKIPSYLKTKAADVVPENIQSAIQYAKETGRRIMTQDVLGERMTPSLQILAKVVERIPIAGTGGQRKEMARQRVDALTELAAKYGIDVETDYGTRVMENFVERMMKRRFWGANEDLVLKGNRTRANEMIERAYEAEMEEISEGVLRNAIRDNRIDDVVVDKVMDSGRPKLLGELFNKLMDPGKEAARRRFLLRGLEESSWTPGAPAVADPKKFLQWLDKPANRKVVAAWFEPEDQQVLNGAREYLRLTAAAQETGKGAGMVAAVGGGLGFMAGVLNALVGSAAVMGGAGRFMQGQFVRNRLLKLAHIAGDEAQTAAIMRELRPYMMSAENQWKQDNYYFPEVNITQESLKEGGEDLLEDVSGAAEDMIGDIGQIPDKLVRFLKGDE